MFRNVEIFVRKGRVFCLVVVGSVFDWIVVLVDVVFVGKYNIYKRHYNIQWKL